MKTKNKIFVSLIMLLAIIAAIVFVPQFTNFNLNAKAVKHNNIKPAEAVQVLQKWDLPNVLREVSGIAYLEEDRFACVQDELGKIFIFNTATSKIEKEISFAGPGDYEGIALHGNTAFIVRSDGQLFEVQNYNGKDPVVEIHKNHLTAEHNIEGLCLDAKQNRLLLAVKDKEPGSKNFKGIYAFSLANKTLAREPVYKIDLKHKVFGKVKPKKQKSVMNPSEVAIHPLTAEIYLTDAKKHKILVMDSRGNLKKVFAINKETFTQPEGIAFSPAGEMFISNEGKTGTANILKVKLHE